MVQLDPIILVSSCRVIKSDMVDIWAIIVSILWTYRTRNIKILTIVSCSRANLYSNGWNFHICKLCSLLIEVYFGCHIGSINESIDTGIVAIQDHTFNIRAYKSRDEVINFIIVTCSNTLVVCNWIESWRWCRETDLEYCVFIVTCVPILATVAKEIAGYG